MATERVSTIRSSGGNYPSLSAWEADFGAAGGVTSPDLVANDEIAVAECYNDWPSGLDDLIVVSGWTTDATRYIEIRPAPGQGHNGVINGGFYINNESGGSVTINNQQDLRLLDLQVDYAAGINQPNIFTATTGTTTFIDRCIIRYTNGTGPYNISHRNHPIVIRNSFVTSSTRCMDARDNAATEVSNCVFWKTVSDLGILTSSPAPVRNVYVGNSVGSGDDFWSGGSTTGSNNASSDGTATTLYTNSLINQAGADVFNDVTENAEDLRLKDGSALIGEGINLYSDFQFDIEGDEWPAAGAWDIGADYFVSAAAPVDVDPVTETLEITTPQVDVQVGLDITVNPVTELLEIATPQVDIEVLTFVNVQPVTVNVEITTPRVDVRAFKDTFVDPITEVVVITTPQVDVKEGIDLNIDVQTAELEITTPPVSVTTEVEYLIATEAVPLQYQVSVGGLVQMETKNSVNAWRNEHGHVSYPFPAVISDQPEDAAVIAPAPALFSVTAIGAASYQWYVDDVPQIGETLSTFTIDPTSPGTYAVRCVVLNGDDFGITSKDAILTVT